MADFPPNLDDGELWLPSDIIRDVGGVPRHSHHQHSPPSFHVDDRSVKAPPSVGFAYIDDLACQLAAVGLLDHTYMLQSSAVAVAVAPAAHAVKPSPKRSSNPQGLKGGRPAFRFEPPPIAGELYDGFLPPAMVMGAVEGGRGGFPCGLVKPVHGRVQQRPPKPVRGRFVPVRSAAGPGRECGGTGVFLPRVLNAPSSINNCSNNNGHTKKKPHGKGGEHHQQQQYTRNAVDMWKQQQGMPFQGSAETGLPKDWTY